MVYTLVSTSGGWQASFVVAAAGLPAVIVLPSVWSALLTLLLLLLVLWSTAGDALPFAGVSEFPCCSYRV